MVKGAEEVVGFVGDGGDDFGIGGGGVQHHKGVVGGNFVAFVNGFSESGKVAVRIEGRGFADENGGVSCGFRALGDKNYIL